MYLKDIPNLKIAIKSAKPGCINLVYQFIFDNDKNRQNRENLHKFEGFKFKVDDENIETELTEVLDKLIKFNMYKLQTFCK